MTSSGGLRRAVLSLGANMGDRLAYLQDAVDRLAEVAAVVAVSPVYETTPVGGPPQADFLNCVVLLDWPSTAMELLQRCHEVELAAGRVRVVRWGPRVVDVDVVDLDGVVSDDETLVVPHPRAGERAFVLAPWLDVDPTATWGTRDVAALLAEVGREGVRRRDDLTLRLQRASR